MHTTNFPLDGDLSTLSPICMSAGVGCGERGGRPGGFNLRFGVAFFLVLATRGNVGPEPATGGEYLEVLPRFRVLVLDGGVDFTRGLTAGLLDLLPAGLTAAAAASSLDDVSTR